MIEALHPQRRHSPQVPRSRRPRTLTPRSARLQRLTFVFDGIDALDYLSWGRDPEPPALGRELLSIATRAEAGEERAIAELRWQGEPPPPRAAARAAGFLLVPEIAELFADTRPQRGR